MSMALENQPENALNAQFLPLVQNFPIVSVVWAALIFLIVRHEAVR